MKDKQKYVIESSNYIYCLDGGKYGKGMVKCSKNRFELRMKPIPVSILDKKLTWKMLGNKPSKRPD